jgi:hypothetical protein
MAHERIQDQALMNMAMNKQVPYNAGNFLTSYDTWN